jgi:hypothetical protein
LVFENAKPACSAARAMPRAQRWVAEVLHQRGQRGHAPSAAATAWVSESGLALTFQIDSSACDSASRPAASVGRRSERASRGSTIAASGHVSRGAANISGPPAVPDRGPRRDLAAGAGRRRNGDQRADTVRRERLAAGEERDQRLEAAVGRAHHQRLGGVDDAAADPRRAVRRRRPARVQKLRYSGPSDADVRIRLGRSIT